MPQLGIDTTGVKPSETFDLLPAGDYLAMIVDSEVNPTKAGDGHYLKLEFQIVGEGAGYGRKVWARLNFDNPSERAKEIAFRDLAAIQEAVGKPGRLDHSEDLHDIPMTIKLKVEKGRDGYQDSNEVKSYKPASVAASAAATPAAKTAPAGTPPWKRG